jgi:hypothetical protein
MVASTGMNCSVQLSAHRRKIWRVFFDLTGGESQNSTSTLQDCNRLTIWFGRSVLSGALLDLRLGEPPTDDAIANEQAPKQPQVVQETP